MGKFIGASISSIMGLTVFYAVFLGLPPAIGGYLARRQAAREDAVAAHDGHDLAAGAGGVARPS